MSGWEPVEVTRYEYDDAGRMVASWTEREAEFSREDVEAMLAFQEMQRVGPHGHPMSEATSPEGDPSNRDRKFTWVVPPPDLDFAQDALEKAIDKFKKTYPDANPNAYKFRVEKRER